MLKNHFLIAVRSLKANKLYSLISLLGLTIGITICLSIFLIVHYELSFNRMIPEGDRIYRINTTFKGVYNAVNRGVPVPAGRFVEDNLTAFDLVAPFYIKNFKISVDNPGKDQKKFDYYSNIIITDGRYFDMLDSYNWVAGDSKAALAEPHSLVLTTSRASIYFGDIPYSEMIGLGVTYNDSLKLQLKGIVEDINGPTDFIYTDFISLSTINKSWLKEDIGDQWGNTNSNSQLFVRTAKGTAKATLDEQMGMINEKRDEMSPDKHADIKFKLQSLYDLHYDQEMGVFDNTDHSVDRDKLYILLLIGVMILLIAVINFVNLETALASYRAKEIGVRKVMGATKMQIVWQFITQSMILTAVSTLLAISLLQPFFMLMSDFVPDGLPLGVANPVIYQIAVVILIIVGIGSGFYPAFVMSSFSPVQAMKSQIYSVKGRNYSVWVRKAMTVFQFGFAQVLIAFTIVAIMQMKYIESYQLGFEASDRIYFSMPWEASKSKREVFVSRMANLPEIESFSSHNSSPATRSYSTTTAELKEGDSTAATISVHWMAVDQQYFDFYGLDIISGQLLKPIDSLNEIMVNESFIKSFGIENPSEAVGMTFNISSKKYQVAGVLYDFHFKSLHHTIEPHAFYHRKTNYAIGVKLHPSRNISPQEAIDKLQETWTEVFGNERFEYTYIADALRDFYEEEKEIAKLIYMATGLSIFIACLGLFGLASFTVAQRTKEIGIRKVLGASVNQVVKLITFDFVKLVLVAFALASPVAYYISDAWLENFAYHYSPTVWVFMLTCTITIAIAFFTLLYQTMTSARANPVESLRNE